MQYLRVRSECAAIAIFIYYYDDSAVKLVYRDGLIAGYRQRLLTFWL